jgi:hypothetical protein
LLQFLQLFVRDGMAWIFSCYLRFLYLTSPGGSGAMYMYSMCLILSSARFSLLQAEHKAINSCEMSNW